MSPRNLGYLCRAFPPAVAAGLGMKPVRAVTSSSSGLRTAGLQARPDLCPFVRSVLDGVCSAEGLFDTVDTWIGMYTCDMTRRLFQELRRITGVPVFEIQLPSTRTAESSEWFAGSVRKLADRLVAEGFSGGYDAERALSWERERLKAAALLKNAALSWSIPPLRLHGMFMDFFTGGTLPGDVPYGGYECTTRVAVTGSVLAGDDDTVPRTLQEMGAGFLPLGCTGLSGLPRTLPADGSAEALSRASFADTLCARNRPNRDTFEWTAEMIRRSGSHGLLLRTLKFCDLWYTEKERFRKSMSIPVLVLDADPSSKEDGQQSVRISAFIETLEKAHE